MTPVRTLLLAGGAVAAIVLGGCTYDYMQHTDRVGYHAGDAVKANLESETVNPQDTSMYKKTGLGEDGDVIPEPTDAAAAAAASP